jgi:hypothetical protein
MVQKEFSFAELRTADLQVDALYKAGTQGNMRDDPLSKLMGCENQGGFRKVGKQSTSEYKLAILFSLLDDPDWPDTLDTEQGVFVYYGDNKEPGHELHDTPKGGNKLLKFCFDSINARPHRRQKVPPFFIFTRGLKGRDVIFRGLAAPGSERVRPTEELVAVWKSKEGSRFQNYQAYFTILNVPIISRSWLADLFQGNPLSQNCPDPWRRWVMTGVYEPLKAKPTRKFRQKSEQLPSNERNLKIVRRIYEYFKEDPFGFQYCAAKIASLMDRNIISCDVTKLWRDGGRDAVGLYRIGTEGDSINVEFALEAKCYLPGRGVGIRDTSRLISRLKHRQFGIFVTTSYIGLQPYQEIREDQHPVIIISAEDIARILVSAGIRSEDETSDWLKANFPKPDKVTKKC